MLDINEYQKGVYLKNKARRLEQIKLSRESDREAAAAWGRVQKGLKASKPANNDNRFKRP